MDLHQYQRYKRRSPVWIIAGIVVLLLALVIMLKKIPGLKNLSRPNYVNLNVSLNKTDSIALPLFFLVNKEIIYFHSDSLKKDTLIKINIASEINIVEVIDNTNNVIATGTWKSDEYDNVFVEFRVSEHTRKPEIIIGSKFD